MIDDRNQLNSIYLPYERYKKALEEIVEQDALIRLEKIGSSENQRDIFELTIGKGHKTAMIWSQMHGNEASGTRGVIRWLKKGMHQEFTNVYTIVILLVINPDGATLFTRRNGFGVDINRDARSCQTASMQILQSRIFFHKPDFTMNLHDQRSVFAAGDTENPAALSFLAPSKSPYKEVTKDRLLTMRLIAGIANALKPEFEGKLGRYNDDFYPAAIGEWVQQQNIPCILVEAGVYDKFDYNREKAVKAHATILSTALRLFNGDEALPDAAIYLDIPENKESFVDIILKNPKLLGKQYGFDLALMKTWRLNSVGELESFLTLTDVGDLQFKHAYEVINSSEVLIDVNELNSLIGKEITFKY